jgi:molybdate transport repressor ModE-like protein
LRTRLPLTALRVLDAAARNGSLTAAAAELGVTRPAVSKQIRQLEQTLDRAMIERFGNTIRLTQAGLELSQSVAQAFDQIAMTVQRIARGAGSAQTIRILVDRDFASSFLAAHIGQFLVLNPGISVEVVAERNRRMRLDEDFNFRIFYGAYGANPSAELREDILCHWYDLPVCTPEYAVQHVGSGGDLIDAQLLIDANYDVWDDWCLQTGGTNPGTARHITRFNETSLCVSAALSGGGITIGDSLLAFPAIQSARLVMPFPCGLESEQCYSIFSRKGSRPTPAESAFHGWLSQLVTQHQADVRAYLVEQGVTLVRRLQAGPA